MKKLQMTNDESKAADCGLCGYANTVTEVLVIATIGSSRLYDISVPFFVICNSSPSGVFGAEKLANPFRLS